MGRIDKLPTFSFDFAEKMLNDPFLANRTNFDNFVAPKTLRGNLCEKCRKRPKMSFESILISDQFKILHAPETVSWSSIKKI